MTDGEWGSERIHYCPDCADHYTGVHCPACGREGELV